MNLPDHLQKWANEAAEAFYMTGDWLPEERSTIDRTFEYAVKAMWEKWNTDRTPEENDPWTEEVSDGTGGFGTIKRVGFFDDQEG